MAEFYPQDPRYYAAEVAAMRAKGGTGPGTTLQGNTVLDGASGPPGNDLRTSTPGLTLADILAVVRAHMGAPYNATSPDVNAVIQARSGQTPSASAPLPPEIRNSLSMLYGGK